MDKSNARSLVAASVSATAGEGRMSKRRRKSSSTTENDVVVANSEENAPKAMDVDETPSAPPSPSSQQQQGKANDLSLLSSVAATASLIEQQKPKTVQVESLATCPVTRGFHEALPLLLTMMASDSRMSDKECVVTFVALIKTCRSFRQSMYFWNCWNFLRRRFDQVYHRFPPPYNKIELSRIVHCATGKPVNLRKLGRAELRRTLLDCLWTLPVESMQGKEFSQQQQQQIDNASSSSSSPNIAESRVTSTTTAARKSSKLRPHPISEVVRVIGAFLTHHSTEAERQEFENITVQFTTTYHRDTGSEVKRVFLTAAKKAFKLDDSDFAGMQHLVSIHRTYHNQIYLYKLDDVIECAMRKYGTVKCMDTCHLEYPGLNSMLKESNAVLAEKLKSKVVKYCKEQLKYDANDKWALCDTCGAWRIITGRRVAGIRKRFVCSMVKRACDGKSDKEKESQFEPDQPEFDFIDVDEHQVLQAHLEGIDQISALTVAKRFWDIQCAKKVEAFKKRVQAFVLETLSAELWRVLQDDYVGSCDLSQEKFQASQHCEDFKRIDNVMPRYRVPVLCSSYFKDEVKYNIAALRSGFHVAAEEERKRFKDVVAGIMKNKLKVSFVRVTLQPRGRHAVDVQLCGTCKYEYQREFDELVISHHNKDGFKRLNLKNEIHNLNLNDVLVDNQLYCSGSIITSKRLEAKQQVVEKVEKAQTLAKQLITAMDMETVMSQPDYKGWDEMKSALSKLGVHHPWNQATLEIIKRSVFPVISTDVVNGIKPLLLSPDLKISPSMAYDLATQIASMEGCIANLEQRARRVATKFLRQTRNQ